jgi:hypothetical protein
MRSPPRAFFLNLGSVVTLYWWTTALLYLWICLVDIWYPPESAGVLSQLLAETLPQRIRYQTASLFVLFPVYTAITWLLVRAAREEPDLIERRGRSWLLYLTLFVAGCAFAFTLVYAVYRFLGDGMAVGLLLKSAAVLLIAAAVFAYCLLDVRGVWLRRPRALLPVAGAAAVVVIAALAGGVVYSKGTSVGSVPRTTAQAL